MKKLILIALIVVMVGCGDREPEPVNPDKQKIDLSKYTDEQKNSARKNVQIDPNMDIVDLAVCTAASMKIGQGIGVYKVWTEELTNRYRKAHPNKSESELEIYSSERIDDKLAYLKGKGLDTQELFLDYYKENCQK